MNKGVIDFSAEEVELIRFLRKDIIKNLNLIYFAEKHSIISFERIGNSVIMRGISDRLWTFISAPDKLELSAITGKLTENDTNFAVIEDWMIPFILQGRGMRWSLSTLRLYLPPDVPLQEFNFDEINPLTVNDAQYIFNHSHFNEFTPVSYISECIENGPSAGIKIDGRLAGWIAAHDDTAIGFLHVIEEYRGKGLAQKLLCFMAKKTREQGRIPFVHIEETNTPSINLALKTGFVKDRTVTWFELNN